jgi:hypothetical protein
VQRCLTIRSTGRATAGHLGPAAGTRYIVCVRAKASCLRAPVSSNVRPRRNRFWRTPDRNVPRTPDHQRSTPAPGELEKLLAPLKEWPDSWTMDDTDIEIGQELAEEFKQFLANLHSQGLAARTVTRHRGNLWVLGGELVRQFHLRRAPRRIEARQLLLDAVSDDGGPLLRHDYTELGQREFDGTCRMLALSLLQGSPRCSPSSEA